MPKNPSLTELALANREIRRLKAAMRQLVRASYSALDGIDVEMRGPSTVERGRKVASFCSYLEFETDQANHSGLGTPLKRLKRVPPRYAPAAILASQARARALNAS